MKRINVIRSYYDDNMQRSEKDHEILGWESKEAQYERFAALADNVDLEGKKLLDVGCGLGNLLEYLNEKKINVDYTGIDVLPEMIDMANKKGVKGKFVCVDLFENNPFDLDSFDVIYASGIFNLNLGNNKSFFEKAMRVFSKISSQYICFNLLHIKSTGKEDTYFYFSPDEALDILDKAMMGMDIKITILEEYLNNDFTIICEK